MASDIIRHYKGLGPTGWKIEVNGRFFTHNERVYSAKHKLAGYLDLRETDTRRVLVRWDHVGSPARGGAWLDPDQLWTQAELELVENTKGIGK